MEGERSLYDTMMVVLFCSTNTHITHVRVSSKNVSCCKVIIFESYEAQSCAFCSRFPSSLALSLFRSPFFVRQNVAKHSKCRGEPSNAIRIKRRMQGEDGKGDTREKREFYTKKRDIKRLSKQM